MANTHPTGKTKIHDDGEEIREFNDGAWRRKDGTLAIAAPHYLKTVHTTEEASELAHIRHQKRQEAIARGAKKVLGGEYNPTNVNAEIAEAIGESAMTLAMAPEEGRAMIEAAKFVMSGIGEPIDMRATRSNTNIAIQINISERAVEGMDEEDRILDAMYKELDADMGDEDGVPF